MTNVIYIIFAILSLSFLIFIHELGHYFMARRVGMRVETFSIGLGSPLVSWMWQGTRWQIGWLLFGGYVRIAGTDSDKEGDLYALKDGFFGKSPWDRIKVSFMGPLVNLLFALLVFALLWVNGGREKPYSDYTQKAGFVDPNSELYKSGVRSGDEIWKLNNHPYQGFQDLLYLAVTSSGPVKVEGAKVDYASGVKTPFVAEVHPYQHRLLDKSLVTTGVMQPARYLIYDQSAGIPLPENSPMIDSGLQSGDRIVWVDGQRIFSPMQLSAILNDGRVVLTVERNGKRFLARAPRVQVQELKFDPAFRDELTDWQFEAQLSATKFQKLYTLPYNLTNDGIVENEVRFIDKDNEEIAFPAQAVAALELPLQPGDRIVAVDGVQVKHSSEILKQLQERNVHVIVERLQEKAARANWRNADHVFDLSVHEEDLAKIAQSIGSGQPVAASGDLVLLKSIKPKTHHEIYWSPEKYAALMSELQAVEDPEKRAQKLQLFKEQETRYEMGIPLHDQKVEYNPVPTDQFMAVFRDIWKTLVSLVTGQLNPKWMSGPVGIVNIFQEQSRSSMADALYWLGAISLNLGILNLLPIPMLDGGTIMLSLLEWITGYKIKPKTMEKLILPFAILLIAFFVFITYNDLTRIFGGLWR